MHKVFAFGTLKQGFPLHAAGLAGAPCLGAYRTVRPFPMFVAGPWFAPMMLDEPGTGCVVRGELYAVDDARLATLDALESIGVPGNLRITVDVACIGGDETVRAFAYVKSPELATPVHSGYLEDYQDRRFIPPSGRPPA